MTDQELQLYQHYEYRVGHLQSVIDKMEKRIMNLRTGHQVLLRVVKFQLTRRTIIVKAHHYPNRLFRDFVHLRSLLNSERYQLYYSYYKTAKMLEVKLKIVEKQSERQCIGRKALKQINTFKSRFLRKVRIKSKRRRNHDYDGQAKLREAYADIQDVMSYLENGTPPPPKRDISRRSRKQREVYFSSISDWKLERILVSKEVVFRPNKNLEMNPVLAYYLGQLSEREREAYILHHGQGLPTGEVARIMRCKNGTVDQLLFRAHRTIENVRQNGVQQPTLF